VSVMGVKDVVGLNDPESTVLVETQRPDVCGLRPHSQLRRPPSPVVHEMPYKRRPCTSPLMLFRDTEQIDDGGETTLYRVLDDSEEPATCPSPPRRRAQNRAFRARNSQASDA